MNKKRVTILVALVSILLSIQAQECHRGNNLLGKFQQRYAVMDSLLANLGRRNSNTQGEQITSVHIVPDDVFHNLNKADIDALKAQNGLQTTGQLYVRPGKGLSYDPDDPLVAYNAKAQVEVNWDFFQSSYYRRKQKIKLITTRNELERMQYERDALLETIADEHVRIRHIDYSYLLGVLKEHSINLALLTSTQSYLLKTESISSDELLKLISEKAELDRQIVSIEADSVYQPRITQMPENIAIDTTSVLSYIRSYYYDVRRLSLQREVLQVELENTNFLSTTHIMPFARLSYYNRYKAHNTQNFDVGISWRIPLSFDTSKKRKAIVARQDVIDAQYAQTTSAIEKQLKLIFTEIASYNNNIRGEYQRMKKLKAYLDIRNKAYRNALGNNYSRLQRLQEYNAYLSSWERMLTFVYQRDERLVDLQAYIINQPLSRFLIKTVLK